jgi:hypothetical protein
MMGANWLRWSTQNERPPQAKKGRWRRIMRVFPQRKNSSNVTRMVRDATHICKSSIRAVPCGLVAVRIARMFQRWGDTPKPSPAQLTALRHLQSDLGPVLANIDAIPDQTDDPALIQAAERVHDALRGLLAEMAVVIYRARRPRSADVPNSVPSQLRGSRADGHLHHPHGNRRDDDGQVAVRRKP